MLIARSLSITRTSIARVLASIIVDLGDWDLPVDILGRIGVFSNSKPRHVQLYITPPINDRVIIYSSQSYLNSRRVSLPVGGVHLNVTIEIPNELLVFIVEKLNPKSLSVLLQNKSLIRLSPCLPPP